MRQRQLIYISRFSTTNTQKKKTKQNKTTNQILTEINVNKIYETYTHVKSICQLGIYHLREHIPPFRSILFFSPQMATDNLFLSGAHSSSQFIFHTVSGCSGDRRAGVTGPTCAAGSPTMIYNVLSSIRLFFSRCSLRSLDECVLCVLCVDNDGIARIVSYAFQPICFFVDELGLSSTPFILSSIEKKRKKIHYAHAQ